MSYPVHIFHADSPETVYVIPSEKGFKVWLNLQRRDLSGQWIWSSKGSKDNGDLVNTLSVSDSALFWDLVETFVPGGEPERIAVPVLVEHVTFTLEVVGDQVRDTIIRCRRQTGAGVRSFEYGATAPTDEQFIEFLRKAYNQAFDDSVISVIDHLEGVDE